MQIKKFDNIIIDMMHEHFFIDKVHDLLFICCGNEESIKVKPMNLVKTCSYPHLTLNVNTLKVVYNKMECSTIGS